MFIAVLMSAFSAKQKWRTPQPGLRHFIGAIDRWGGPHRSLEQTTTGGPHSSLREQHTTLQFGSLFKIAQCAKLQIPPGTSNNATN
jgi:hypothetical protein